MALCYLRHTRRTVRARPRSSTRRFQVLTLVSLFNNANKLTSNTRVFSPSFGQLNNVDASLSAQLGLR
jgi:hypothetical protein